jgi:hypothetical protein
VSLLSVHSGLVVVQLAVAAAALGLVVRAGRRLAIGLVDEATLRRALRRHLLAGDVARVEGVIDRLRGTWAGRVLAPIAGEDLERALYEVEEERVDAEAELTSSLRALRVLATVASALGFLAAALCFGWVFRGEHGLMALRAGWAETVGLNRAVLSIALGVATSSFALGAWGLLSRRARRAVTGLRRLCTMVEDLFARGIQDGPVPGEPS